MRDDVLIVGAGPTGLTLALWLTRQGTKVRIVDRATGPGTTSRALAVQARTLELYRQLGITDKVIAEGSVNKAITVWARGEQRGKVTFANAGETLTPYPFVLVYPQDAHEKLLVAALEAEGVQVEWETECLRYEDKGDHVVAHLKTGAGAGDGPGETTCEARFLAACDGAGSTIRHQLAIPFAGGTYEQIFYVADVEASGPAMDGGVNLEIEAGDFVLLLSYGSPGRARLAGAIKPEHKDRTDALTFEDVRDRAIEALKLKVEKVNWFSTYHVHHRVAAKYRVGRAFLLGDAAHVHSPAGGQGMNTGIGDAANLAWKLSAVLNGHAPDGLLDSYEPERAAFAHKLVETTDRMFTMATSKGGIATFFRSHVLPGLATALTGIAPVRHFIFRTVSQIDIDYRDSALSQGKAGKVAGGDRLPWLPIGDTDNHASLSSGGWQVHVYGEASPELREWCEENGVACHVFDWREACGKMGLARDALYLIRPDSYVALAEEKADCETLAAYFRDRQIDPARPSQGETQT
ncbi:FAD-dependent oxidoreductase [Rhizobium halophytocola]|uniref:2-polyprenyl-6-methoxyphenol hydroxylase-like FAD-dependent oxidoreductase n=1 Tax=Rhizobium halophytocola TaxID=735519 RepID=A0ABS4E1X2_9HYPH|nr:FAD-dependent oxidoreductase [Rhizobium halophytocola]MBP1851940.1 2-polyprenyl-6-methoxyphenol hydroxylase-like FAD-dependent oxidoreductase [Rhizobium halophytocola]